MSDKNKTHALLTLEVDSLHTSNVCESIRHSFSLEPVEIVRSGVPTQWVEIYFPSEIEALLASSVLAHREGVLGSSV